MNETAHNRGISLNNVRQKVIYEVLEHYKS